MYHTYYADHYWYNGFFHPFGWGYGGGDFWFWMWLFDHNQYQQNQQIIQASQPAAGQTIQAGNTAYVAPQHTNYAGTAFGLLAIVAVVAAGWALLRFLRRHLLYVK